MSVRVTGDFAKLSVMVENFKNVSPALRTMGQGAAEEALDLVREGFAAEKDPYGKRWKRKKRPDGRAVLVGKTANLRRGWHVVRSGRTGFSIAASVKYAGFHQGGTKHLRARMMVPNASKGLPTKWARAIEDAGAEALTLHFSLFGKGGAGGRLGFIKGKIVGLKRRFSPRAFVRKAMGLTRDNSK